MKDTPMVHMWMGENGPENIDTLPREKLIEIIHYLAKSRTETFETMRRLSDLAARRR